MLNFGLIKETLNDILVEGILKKDAEKKIIFQKYIAKIKKNPVLREQFLVYKNIESKLESDNSRIDSYIIENIYLLKRLGLDKLRTENKKLLSELKVTVKSNISYDKKVLHEEICNLITYQKTAKNVNRIVESVSKISDYIKTNKIKEGINENTVPSSILAKISIEKFNHRYSDLTETEQKMIAVMVEGKEESKTALLKEAINDCITLIDENYENSDLNVKDKLLKAKHKLMKMSYTNESFVSDISTVVKLTESLKPSIETED